MWLEIQIDEIVLRLRLQKDHSQRKHTCEHTATIHGLTESAPVRRVFRSSSIVIPLRRISVIQHQASVEPVSDAVTKYRIDPAEELSGTKRKLNTSSGKQPVLLKSFFLIFHLCGLLCAGHLRNSYQ